MGLFYKILIFLFLFHINCGLIASIFCGTERSDVKHLSDKEAVLVNMKPSLITLDSFLLLDVIHMTPAFSHKRITRMPSEMQVYSVEVFIKFWILEQDNDYHIVCCDSNFKKSFIAEVPSPECSESILSGHAAQYRNCRNLLDSLYFLNNNGKHFFNKKFPLIITGVLFHDFVHGQTGRAPNGIELHPVLSITY
jgi:hypothetical protein